MIDNILYESSEISQPDDFRLFAPQKKDDVQNLATDHLQDHRRSWAESAYSSVDKVIPEEHFESSEEYKPDDLRLAASQVNLDEGTIYSNHKLQDQCKPGKSWEENAYATVDKGIPEYQFVENALYESSEHYHLDDMCLSASHTNLDVRGPDSDSLPDHRIRWGENAYSIVNKDSTKEQFAENALYESSEHCHLDDMRLSASHTNWDMFDHLQDHGISWGENCYSIVNKDSTIEQFVENALYESSDGILGSSDPPQEELVYSEITF